MDLRKKVKAIKRLFYPLGMATLIGFFAILTSYTNAGFQELDVRSMEQLHGNTLLGALSIFGEQTLIFLVGLALIVFLWMKRQDFRGMFFVFLTIGVGNALNQLMEYFFVNERPDLPRGLETFSFPSSHAMVGLLYLFTLAYFITNYSKSKTVHLVVWTSAVLLSAGAGLSQIAEGAHFFSDVLAGWFIGYSLFVAAAIWYEMRERNMKKAFAEQRME